MQICCRALDHREDMVNVPDGGFDADTELTTRALARLEQPARIEALKRMESQRKWRM